MMMTPMFFSPLPRSRKPVAPVNLPAPEKRNVCATSFTDPPATAQSLETPRDLGSSGARSAASAGNRLREKLLLGGKVQPAGTERTGRNSSQSKRTQSQAEAAHDLHDRKVSEAQTSRHSVQPKGEVEMNRDIAAGKWQQLRGKVKEQWGKLTDDDLAQANGKFDKLAGSIRERYGYTRERAEEELGRFCKTHDI